MIKKLQHYLLIHYPLLWNIRILPVAIIVILAHILFFLIGYGATDSSFNNYSYGITNDIDIIYSTSVLASILIVVIWLFIYMRNNAFRSFYPFKAKELYFEWILILFISFVSVSIYISLTAGAVNKWQSSCSKEDFKSAKQILQRSEILIPDYTQSYSFDPRCDTVITYHATDLKLPKSSDIDLKDIKSESIILEYTSPSLLYYKGAYKNDYIYYKNNDNDTIYLTKNQKVLYRNIDTVKYWLQNRQADSIYALMGDFLKLLPEHSLYSNLNIDEWFERVYNPPCFPVSVDNLISSEDYDYYYKYTKIFEPDSGKYYVITNLGDTLTEGTDRETDIYMNKYKEYYAQYDRLRSGYDKIQQAYDYDYSDLITIAIYVALSISSLVFSFRCTSGKHWLIALIIAGILLFVYFFASLSISEFLMYHQDGLINFCFFWVITCILLILYLLHNTLVQKSKKKSAIALNLFLWIIPYFVPCIMFITFYIQNDDFDYDNRRFIFYINIPIVILVMPIIIRYIHKWKSLPEE